MTETLVIRLYSRVYIFSKRSGGEGSVEVEADYIAVLKALRSHGQFPVGPLFQRTSHSEVFKF